MMVQMIALGIFIKGMHPEAMRKIFDKGPGEPSQHKQKNLHYPKLRIKKHCGKQ